MLLLAAVIVVLYSGWLLHRTLEQEQLAAKQRLSEAYAGFLQAGEAQLNAAWEARLASIEELVKTLSPPEAFQKLVTEGHASSVRLFDRFGNALYPTLLPLDLAEVSETDRLLLERCRNDVERWLREQAWDQAVKSLESLTPSQFGQVRDRHGRVPALGLARLVIDSLPKSERGLAGRVRERLWRTLNTYRDSSVPSSQRRYLMNAFPEASFPTREAENLASMERFVRSAVVSDRMMIDRGESMASYLTHGGRVQLLYSREELRSMIDRALSELNLPQGAEIEVIPLNETSLGEIMVTHALANWWEGWQLAVQVPSAYLESLMRKRRLQHLFVGGISFVCLALLAWLISHSLSRQVRQAQLKEGLAATISHELKTPLSSMRLLVDILLAEEHPDAKQTREYLGIIAEENARLSHLIENFLTYARIEKRATAFKQEVLCPSELLEESYHTACRNFAGDRLRLESADSLAPIQGDRAAVVTTLLNLLDNACKYSPEDSSVTLRGFQREKLVCFEVEDRGRGLSLHEQQRVFGMFHQLDGNQRGCGLGLHIVRSVVAALGGKIEVDSEPNRGCRFRLLFPIAA